MSVLAGAGFQRQSTAAKENRYFLLDLCFSVHEQALFQFICIMNCLSCFSSVGKVSNSTQNKQSQLNNSAKRQALPDNSEPNRLAMSNANIVTRPLEEGDYNKGKLKASDHIFTASSFNQFKQNFKKILLRSLQDS